jgi:predicted  nucleic acid-binding Zn-ribbon protein
MREQIEALRKLQAQDHNVVKLERRLAAIPKRLAEIETDLGRLEILLNVERSKLEESRKFKARLEISRQEDEDTVAASKTRLNGIKNARELAAAQREVESARRSAQNRVEEIADLDKAIEAAQVRIVQVEESLTQLRGQCSGEVERLNSEKATLEEAVAKHAQARKAASSRVERSLLSEYERIRGRAGGVAFVPVREQRCGGCKIQVAHRVYVALRAADSIPTCESCGRMLYWAGLFSAEHTPSPEAAGLPMKAADPEAAKKPKRSAPSRKPTGETSERGFASLPSRPPAPRKAAPASGGTKSSKREAAPARPFRLSPKPSPEKVVNDPMALDDDAPKRLHEVAAPKAPPVKATVGIVENDN